MRLAFMLLSVLIACGHSEPSAQESQPTTEPAPEGERRATATTPKPEAPAPLPLQEKQAREPVSPIVPGTVHIVVVSETEDILNSKETKSFLATLGKESALTTASANDRERGYLESLPGTPTSLPKEWNAYEKVVILSLVKTRIYPKKDNKFRTVLQEAAVIMPPSASPLLVDTVPQKRSTLGFTSLADTVLDLAPLTAGAH